MTKEELEFLKNLQNELRTQDNEGNASPVFWGILETGEQITKDGYGDKMYIVDTGNEAKKYELEDFVKHIDEIVAESDDPDLKYDWRMVEHTDIIDVEDFANNHLDMEVEISEFTIINSLSDRTGCFITKKAVENHIKLNSYHYSNPRPYAMTAWRNPEFEKFIEIFEKLDLTELEKLVK